MLHPEKTALARWAPSLSPGERAKRQAARDAERSRRAADREAQRAGFDSEHARREAAREAERLRLARAWASAPPAVTITGHDVLGAADTSAAAPWSTNGVYKRLSQRAADNSPLYTRPYAGGAYYLSRDRTSGRWCVTANKRMLNTDPGTTHGLIRSSRSADLPSEIGLAWQSNAAPSATMQRISAGFQDDDHVTCTEGVWVV